MAEHWSENKSIRAVPFGAAGVYVDLDLASHPARARLTGDAARALEAALPRAEIVRGAGTLAVFSHEREIVAREVILRCLREAAPLPFEGQVHHMPVVYDGPDLDQLAAALRLSPGELVGFHTGQEFFCELVGFMPGFAYLGVNPEPLVAPRRASPRARVPAGSVALAGPFSGIYPLESPGGWHLIGRSLGPPLFDPSRSEPTLFAAGDHVRFVNVSPSDAPRPRRALDIRISLSPESRHGLLVLDVPPLATLQDEGRSGALARGIPASGPLAPGARREVERLLDNPRGAATLEIVGGAARFRAVGRIRVALDGTGACTLEDGETFMVTAGESWARYLAVEGGFEAASVLGSCATLIAAGIGGYRGRALRRGDFLALAGESSEPASGRSEGSGRLEALGPKSLASEESLEVQIEPGPHLDHFQSSAFERLLESEYEVSPVSNRVGQRLLGPKIERLSTDTLLPTPMIRGAIEVPASGEPIVLGPDHPTTGGYPVLAVVRPESWDALGRLRPGRRLRFGRLE